MATQVSDKSYEVKVSLPDHHLDSKVPEGYRGTLTIKLTHKPTTGFRSVHLRKSAKPVLTLSICGDIKFGAGGSVGGQCEDTILKYWGHIPEVAELCALWERWHLNELQAGTKAQMEIVRNLPKCPVKTDWYTWASLNLQSQGLFEDRGYSFGREWLFETIPAKVVKRIKALAKEIDPYQ